MNILKFGLGLGIAAGAAGLGYALLVRPRHLRRGATWAEVQRALPGDDLVPDPTCGYTHAITIQAPVARVWPWLVQVGYRRAGWYSHDSLHRLMGIAGSVDDERTSARRIIPELQGLKVGDTVEIGPGMGYTVTTIEPEKLMVWLCKMDTAKWVSLAASDPLPPKYMLSSWVWVFEAVDPQTTRLIVRVRTRCNPGLLNSLTTIIPNDLGSLIMQPEMLRGLKLRSERMA